MVQQVSNGSNVCSRAWRLDPAAVDKALHTALDFKPVQYAM